MKCNFMQVERFLSRYDMLMNFLLNLLVTLIYEHCGGNLKPSDGDHYSHTDLSHITAELYELLAESAIILHMSK